MFYRCFFFVFFLSAKNMRQPFSGTAERIFMKLLPNDTGKNGVCNIMPPLGESRAAAWRMANVDDLRHLRYDSFAITRGCHRRLRYTTMSGRIDVMYFFCFFLLPQKYQTTVVGNGWTDFHETFTKR